MLSNGLPMPRRFTQEEAQRIFARVAERERTAPSSGGLSLGELEEAAGVAGLDPSLVAGAVAELDATPNVERTLGGAPVDVTRHRVVPTPLDDDVWERVVGSARQEFGEPGVAGQVGRLREWSLLSGTKNATATRLLAEPTDEGTRVTLSQSIRRDVLGLTIVQGIQASLAVLFGVLAAVGVGGPELWVLASVLLALGTLFAVGTQVGSRVWHRRQSARSERLLDRVDLAARDAAPLRPLGAPVAGDAPAPAAPLAAHLGETIDEPAASEARARGRLRE